MGERGRNGQRERSGRGRKPRGLSNTRRAAVVAIVVCALAFTTAVPLRTYLAQRSDVSVQQQRQAELQNRVAELEARKAELADPAQVEAEARRRLRYVMPGQTPYIVQLPEDKAKADQRGRPDHGGSDDAWYERLWSSIAE